MAEPAETERTPTVLATRQWTGSIMVLGSILRTEARQRRGSWAWYLLPSGICVAMRSKAAALEVRLSRQPRPATEEEWAAWNQERDECARFLGCATWPRGREESSTGSVAATWHSPEEAR